VNINPAATTAQIELVYASLNTEPTLHRRIRESPENLTTILWDGSKIVRLDAIAANCVKSGMHNAMYVVDWANIEGASHAVTDRASISQILEAAIPGDPGVVERLLPLVYDELRAIAGNCIKARPGATLQPTELVHEAYVRLIGSDRPFAGRDHFMATAAMAMRHILVDHARKRNTDKRGGDLMRANMDVAQIPARARDMRVLDLDQLLTRLSAADGRAARVAEMRLFGGMTHEQIAVALGVSRGTVVTDWQFARAWLAAKASTDAC
jgi:RNA polymerase sigma factor (TIGR02999 family)